MKPVTVLLTAVFFTTLLITGCRSRGSNTAKPTVSPAATAATAPTAAPTTMPETTESTVADPTIPSGNGPIDETTAPENTDTTAETAEPGSTRRR